MPVSAALVTWVVVLTPEMPCVAAVTVVEPMPKLLARPVALMVNTVGSAEVHTTAFEMSACPPFV
jgi:hypothetical protein